jgi:hypothetical protein
MKKLTIATVIWLLAGCVNHVALISQDGLRYEIKVDQLARKLSAVIDGVAYTGTTVGDNSTSFGTAQTLGMKPVYATGTSFTVGSGGRALLVAATGDYIECGYTKNGTTIIGQCQSNKGRQFVLTTE